MFSQNYACEDCGISIEELTPRMFSFNNPYRRLSHLHGPGLAAAGGPGSHHPRSKSLSILEGAITAPAAGPISEATASPGCILRPWPSSITFPLTTPVEDLPDEVMHVILYGTGGEKLKLHYDQARGSGTLMQPFEGIVEQCGAPLSGDPERLLHARELEECMSAMPLSGLRRENG